MVARLAVLAATVAALATVPPAFVGQAGAVTSSCGGATTSSAINSWHPDSVTGSTAHWYRFAQTTSDRVLVTLGGLKADLSLDLYDSSCHLVASSHRSGLGYEEIYRYDTAGTYYARVSSAAGGASSYQLKFRVLPNAVTVVTSRARVTDGRIEVVGEVLNNTTRAIEDNEIDIVFFDAAKHVLTTGWNNTYSLYVAPGQRAPFIVVGTVPPTYASYQIYLPQPNLAEAGDGLVVNVTHDPTVVNSDGSLQYPGTIENPNKYGVHRTFLTAVIRDAYGSVLYFAFADNGNYLGPGKSERYTLYFPTVSGENGLSFYVGACNGDFGC